MVVIRNDSRKIFALQKYLAIEFKDLGQLKYFLGIEVVRLGHGISLCQRKYVLDLLIETSMLNCNPTKTPIEMNHKLVIQKKKKILNK